MAKKVVPVANKQASAKKQSVHKGYVREEAELELDLNSDTNEDEPVGEAAPTKKQAKKAERKAELDAKKSLQLRICKAVYPVCNKKTPAELVALITAKLPEADPRFVKGAVRWARRFSVVLGE